VGQIEDAFPYHLQDTNGTDKKVVKSIRNVADNISYHVHAANFGENAINTTAARRRLEVWSVDQINFFDGYCCDPDPNSNKTSASSLTYGSGPLDR
jgi:hypothetical protein